MGLTTSRSEDAEPGRHWTPHICTYDTCTNFAIPNTETCNQHMCPHCGKHRQRFEVPICRVCCCQTTNQHGKLCYSRRRKDGLTCDKHFIEMHTPPPPTEQMTAIAATAVQAA